MSFGNSSAQKANNDKNTFFDAEYFLISEEYSDALFSYLQLHKNDPDNGNINYRIGLCLLNINGRKTGAIEYLENAADKISKKYTESHFNETAAPPQTLFLLGTAYQINNQLDQAILSFNNYKEYLNIKDVYEIDFVDKQIKSCETAKKYMWEPVKLESRVLDDVVPQRAANFNPVLSADGDMLIFVYSLKFYAAVYMVRKQDNNWTNRVNITSQLMSDGDCYPTSITSDGKTLYLIKKTNYESDIYVSQFDGEMWTPVEKLSKPINSNNVEAHAGISADGNTLYFTSNRKNGLGGLDIYSSRKTANGKWEEPENLGNTINTKYNENTPFILPDGKTLFFSSQGHDGMGGFDTYKSVMQGENSWSVPQNLGYPWNSTDDNVFYYPIENGEKVLYAGIIDKEETRASIKELSLLRTKNIQNSKVELKGVISFQDNAISNNSVKIDISGPDGRIIDDSLVVMNMQTGEFSILVDPGKYTLLAKADNYKSKSEIVEINEDYSRSDFIVNFALMVDEMNSGEYIIIKNLFFDFNSSSLNQLTLLEIERLYKVMMQHPELHIEVTGHTDSKGNADYNLKLSVKRANSVIEYLVNKGIARSRFLSKGVGELNNIAINQNPDGSDNPEGRKRNRNVSIKILKSVNQNIVVEPIQIPNHLKPKSQTIYSIILVESDKALDNSYFTDINSIITEGVVEENNKSKYVYSYGKFYSINQAKEVLQSQFLSKFEDARIENTDTLEILFGQTRQIAGSSSFKFGIQIYAFMIQDNAKKIENISDYRVYKCNDGFYRVIFENYMSREEATKGLKYMRENGYNDAFIVDFEQLRKTISKKLE